MNHPSKVRIGSYSLQDVTIGDPLLPRESSDLSVPGPPHLRRGAGDCDR